jgi:ABC-type multidrug transport system ATPase subunit
MPQGLALEFSGVTKRFGAITAVSEFSARIESGRVTGFLGPNGAGKTTSLRMLLGLVRPTSGTATIGGLPYAKLDRPLQTVGAVLEASSYHPGRTAANHLAVYAQAARIPRSRVDEVLGLVGLADAGGRKIGGFSLGMRQRLGLAYALLGDPGILVLDEPANGLDPEGIKWMRGFLRQLAREGRTVLTSSHLLAEVQQTADSLLIISHGRLVFEGGLEELADPTEYVTVIDAPDRPALIAALTAADVSFEVLRSGLTIRGLEPADAGAIAASAGVALSSLHRRGPALEEVFLELVDGTRMHPSTTGLAGAAGAAAVAAGAVERVAEPEAESVAGSEPVAVAVAETVAHSEPVAVVEPIADPEPVAVDEEPDAAAEPAGESEPAAGQPQPPAGFVVAGTGVIDVVAAEEAEAQLEPTNEEAEPEHGNEDSVAEPGGHDEAQPEGAEPAAEEPEAAHEEAAPASEEPASQPEEIEPAAQQPEDSDDLEGLDEDELTVPAPAESSESERPWEDYVKTDSDLEADAFFASFDHAEAARRAAGDPSEPGTPQVADESPDEPHQPDSPPEASPDESEGQGGHDDGGEQR